MRKNSLNSSAFVVVCDCSLGRRLASETVDTGDDGEGGSGSQSGNADSAHRRRRRKKLKRHPCTVVNPDENFYFYWLFLISVCVLYNLWTLIVRQSFPELQAAANTFWFVCDVFTDVVFVLDVAVQLRTGYLEQGLMVYNSKKLAGHYIGSRAFLLDLCALIPFDWLQFNVGMNPMLRFPRFLKVYRVYNYYYMVESRTVYPNLWRVVNLIHILLILAHWFGCFYYLLSEAEGFQGDWVYPYRPGDYATLTRKYLGSLYWSTLTLTTIGDLPTPETNADKSSTDGLQTMPRRGHKSRLLQFNSNKGYIFTIVSYLIGVFIFATIVGQVGNVITNRNANRLEFERLLDGAKTYMRHHKVPGGMKRRVLRWYDYSWSRGRIQGGGDINTALGLLPDKLKTELALHVNLSVLKKVTIFHECQPEFLHDLVLKMKAYIFTPGDLICRKGEVAREMFIIADGILEVKSETGRVLTTMQAGDFFGEIGILNLDGLNKRTADVRSVGYSELFSLSREDILAAMKDYPEAEKILHTLGRKRLNEARNLNRASKSGAPPEPGKQSIMSPMSPEMFDNHTGKRIVEKIRSDVKGLKNVLRKSRRGTRSKDECLELQPLTNVTCQQEEGPKSSKGILCRMPRVWSDETSQEDEPSSSETKIGAGLPLLQRLKLLKEKQDNEAAAAAAALSATESKKQSVSSTVGPTSPKEEPEPPWQNTSLPLLQRILMLKQKEDKETAAMQTTANMTAQVLASTVRTQHRSPPLSITKQLKNEKEDNSTDETVPKSCISRISSLKKGKDTIPGKNGNVSWKDIESSSTESAERKLSVKPSTSSSDVHVKKPIILPRMKGTEDKQGERPLQPWALLKKNSTCLKTASVNVKTIKLEETASSHITQVDSSSVSAPSHSSLTCTECLPGPSYHNVPVSRDVYPYDNTVSEPSTSDSVCSVTKQSDSSSEVTECCSESAIVLPAAREKLSDKGSTLAQDKMNAQTRLIMEDNNLDQGSNTSSNSHKSLLLKFDSYKDKKGQSMDLYRVSSFRTRPPLVRFQNESKMYKSIDDLSPEYSGLPFVKKLKILNERQKLAELEKNVFLRSSSLDSGGVDCGNYNSMFDTSSLTRSHSEAIAIEVVLRNQMLSERLAMQSHKDTLAASLQQQSTDSASALLSPESNETAERRNLKSILKNLSSGSLIPTKTNDVPDQTSLPVASVTSRTVTTSVDLRKLMRAQTVEGYAARHSKFTKSVTFNRDTLQSPPPSTSSSALTEGNLFFPVNKSSIEVEEKMSSRLCLPSDSSTVIDIPSLTSHTSHVLGSSNGMTLPGNFNTAPTSPDLIPFSDSFTSTENEVSNISSQVTSGSVVPCELTSTIPISKQIYVQSTFKDPKEMELTKKQLQTTWIERPTAKQKNFFRPGSILLPTHASQEEEYYGGILGGIKEIIKNHLEEIQSKFQTRFHDLEMEVKKRDDIIAQLQERIQELEQQAQMKEESSECDEISDSPFMRGDSADTVLTSPHPSHWPSTAWPKDRKSWEDHSEEENLELMDLPRSITPQSVWNSTTVEIGSDTSSSCSTSEADDVFSPENIRFQNHNQDWEVQMLAEELDRREGLNNQQQMSDLSGRNVQSCVRRRAVSFDSVSREHSVRSQRTGSVDYQELKKTKETSRTPPKKQRLHSAQSLEEKNDSAGRLSSLYRRSLSIGTLHNSLSSSLLRSLGNLIRSNPQSTPLTSSPDILPTISSSCPPPQPPPQPPDI